MPIITAIIPARMASTRFPGKPLKKILGLSMVEHVRRRVQLCSGFDRVVVATCDQEIYEEVVGFGGSAVMTAATHVRCTERVAEAIQMMDADIVVNVQGDMPLVRPEMLQALIDPLLADPSLTCTDLMAPIRLKSEFYSPNVVKVVVNQRSDALYYSRQPIPVPDSTKEGFGVAFKQMGINAFRKDFLNQFVQLSPTPLEKAESVDMQRLLEHGFSVRMVVTEFPVIGVDTPEDLVNTENLMKSDSLYPKYRQAHGS